MEARLAGGTKSNQSVMKRRVEAELLDVLPADDRRAIRSRRDLRRVNAWMGNHTIMAHALQLAGADRPPKEVVELGAGDGNFLLRVAQKIAPRWPDVKVTLLDRRNAVAPQTLAAFAALGWRAEVAVADVFEWRPARADLIVANLFLHHFTDARLRELLRLIAEGAGWFVAIEPHRFALPWLCGQMLWFIGASGVTRHDGVASIAAGFVRQEISALWPDPENWQLTERRAGLFSHLFVARKRS
jgi:ubiquinone/menaquinone biosynthesis C-methylase UbiE